MMEWDLLVSEFKFFVGAIGMTMFIGICVMLLVAIVLALLERAR